MTRTYGTLKLSDKGWHMSDIPPHVAIRLKHLFPRIPKYSVSPFLFPNDMQHCADIAWFIQRYPMLIEKPDQDALYKGQTDYELNQERMEAILRPDFQPLPTQGLKEGQSIRLYQQQAIALTLTNYNLLLADDVGLGKTYSAAGLLLHPETLPAAFVVQTHLQNQTEQKINDFTHLRVHKIKGTKPYTLPPADVYIFKYSQLSGWVDTFGDNFFKAVVFDEIQELRTGSESAKGAAASVLSKSVTYRLALSATPIYNYGTEIFNIMQFIDPSVLGDEGDFKREWCGADYKTVNDPEALGSYLRERNVMLRRRKADVGQQLPRVNTIIETIQADQEALKSIEATARMLAIKTTQGSFFEKGRAGRELDLMLRQSTGVAKAVAAANYTRILLESGIKVVLVGWHREVYSIWQRELADFNPAMYTGTESPRQKDQAVRRFTDNSANDKTDLFILSLRSGAGLDGLQHVCSTVIFGELDWSPQVHHQVIGRLDREWQEEQITAIYLNTDEGSDPPMIELLGLKSFQSTALIDPGQKLAPKYSDKSRIQALAAQYLSKRKAA
ncbi:DEAD/DEAH box helicase (plasmid) [Shewanella xiamenensis]|uniref:DEAD/DEAH box helicase n=1 Tax=Shewanella xiamenensis TaxID=332186 RepID=A0ABT6UDH4_9GAMM|nr:DEAD/DEAH box helicase [Shewanella xiamenensis]MDI5832513.1 DEAD/DEAH box helicase [Shewanella xiamenensis]WHF57868.1 DEAD/DEAH box helicase [Shewanella xiamenensis]